MRQRADWACCTGTCRAVSINAGKASPTEPGQGRDRPGSRRGLLPMRGNTPSVIIQPVLIGRNAPDQVESRLTGRMPPNGLNALDRVYSFRWGAYCLRRCGAGVRAQASSLDDARDRAATNALCRFIPTCRGWRTDALLCGLVGIPINCASRHGQLPLLSFKFAMDGIDRS